MMDELFKSQSERIDREIAPLADRMRPRSLEEFIGQEHLVGKGRLIQRLVEQKKLASLILWGPPGSGKTTLAKIICEESGAHFLSFSAVLSGLSELRACIKEADKIRRISKKRTVLFVDEIHRWNKAQQDAFLPYVEKGKLILIGATTENPSFEVIAPLLSRTRVCVLKHLEKKEIEEILKRAIKDTERGLFMMKKPIKVEDRVIDYLARLCDGDARRALNALELSLELAVSEGSNAIRIEHAEEALTSRCLVYDKTGEEHYNLISAFIKSMRGSDPDATIYWMVRMLESGEDPRFICRRMIIFASEDVGLADPKALQLAVACEQALEVVGLPEAMIPMAQTCIYLATAPKSNSAYMALGKAREKIKETGSLTVPLHLRNPVTALMKELGYGRDYKYPHNYEGHYVEEEYLPEELQGTVFYEPGELGAEAEIKERIERLRRANKGKGKRDNLK